MKLSRLILTTCMLCATMTSNVMAQDFLTLGIGKMEVLDSDDMWDVRAEYRWGEGLIWQIKPFIGVEVNDEGALYGLGGLFYDFGMAPHWYLTPSFGAGLWHDGGGPDLGNAIEFRSQIEVAYEFENGHRLSTSFSHISNAGLGDRNPGTEVLNIQWHVPVSWWSGQ